EAVAALEYGAGTSLMRKNISNTPAYLVDKPKLDIMPVWVDAKNAGGQPATIKYRDQAGNLIESRDKAKPIFVTYTEVQDPNPETEITRAGSDIITAVSLDDGNTWNRFNLSHMAKQSSFTLKSGEKFPGDCRGPQQKIAGDKILISWTSAYARGGKPSFAISQNDTYPGDDLYAVTDHWGVRGRQGSVDYDLDKDVGDQGIGEIPYYALWTCRGVVVYDGNLSKFPGHQIGDIIWFKPERVTSGRRDAFFVVSGSAKNVGFAVAWQEDPGGLLPGSCKGGGDGWSGATVHKKTDIWYSYINYADFDKIDTGYVATLPEHAADEFGGPDMHAAQTEIADRPKWLVPMSLPVRVSDNNAVNTDNLKVQLDESSGLPVIDPVTGKFIPLDGAEERDHTATEHEGEGNCGDTTHGDEDDHGGSQGTGGGWGMARYAYMLDNLDLADQTETSTIWDARIDGDYRPVDPAVRWFRFVNKPGVVKTVVVTADGRVLDGDTGACRPMLSVMPGGWTILGYEETKGLGQPPEGDHEEVDVVKPEAEDSGKNIIYHSFKFNQPDLVSAGNILNLPALDDNGELIPIYYKDAAGENTSDLRQYKTENARRVRFIAQPKEWLKWGTTNTSLIAVYRQGREGEGAPADIFGIRAVVPKADTGNPYRFNLLQRYETAVGTVSDTEDPYVMRFGRKHMNLSSVDVVEMDPYEVAGDMDGNTWPKVGRWNQDVDNLSDESFDNPYSDAKAHRGFLRGDKFVFGYSFTPNWGPLNGDHMDFYVRRSFDGGQT
ncbi:MAG TPA: choice-of-anchor O protein, partial [Oceanipulchritudo sp.]|nr:choice-of-anchor O protein [Oceanipulchritudo sp.]